MPDFINKKKYLKFVISRLLTDRGNVINVKEKDFYKFGISKKCNWLSDLNQ